MAGLDTSIYSMYQAPDIAGSYAKGIKLSDMIKESRDRDKKRQDESLLNMAMKNNLATNENGVELNQSEYLAELARSNPILAYKEKTRLGKQAAQKSQLDIDTRMKAYDYAAKTLPMITSQESYDAFLKQGEAMAPGFSQPFPQYYDPNFNESFQNRLLSAKDKLDMDLKRQELEYKKTKRTEDKTNSNLDYAMKLRKERSGLPVTKDTQSIATAYNKIQSAAAKPTAAGDLSLIFNFMKMLDPGSVVREGEFATAQNAAGVPQRVANVYNQILKGQRLSPSQREDFLGQAQGAYNAQIDVQKKVDANFSKLASEAGLDERQVIIDFSANQPKVLNQKPKQVMQNGHVYTLNEETGNYE